MINSSLDWSFVESDLCRKARGLSFERDIKRMVSNIRTEVTSLSKAEVMARTGRPHLAEALLVKINEDIETVEGFLLVAALLG